MISASSSIRWQLQNWRSFAEDGPTFCRGRCRVFLLLPEPVAPSEEARARSQLLPSLRTSDVPPAPVRKAPAAPPGRFQHRQRPESRVLKHEGAHRGELGEQQQGAFPTLAVVCQRLRPGGSPGPGRGAAALRPAPGAGPGVEGGGGRPRPGSPASIEGNASCVQRLGAPRA